LTEYVKLIPIPLKIEPSTQVVVVRFDVEHALTGLALLPATFVTLHDRKLQYDPEHALAPALQTNGGDEEEDADDEEPDTEANARDVGELADAREADEVETLCPTSQLQPSATVYTYALFASTFASMHCVVNLDVSALPEHAVETGDDTPFLVLVTTQEVNMQATLLTVPEQACAPRVHDTVTCDEMAGSVKATLDGALANEKGILMGLFRSLQVHLA
jgi:hypothetical protein